jgi:ABC-type branched-subunit amino acid transport system permease subunit
MISKRFSIIYLSIAPVLFLLSWYISYRIQDHFMSGTKGIAQQQAHINPILYASIFTGIYLAAYLVIRDIYRPTKHQ